MASIKIENVDAHSSIPLVFDVTSETEKDPVATHRLTFGQFVIVGSLENLHMVSVEEWQQREADEAAEAKEQMVAPSIMPAPATAKVKRADLEAMTKDELVEYAEDEDIEVNAHWNKADIIDAIMKG